MKENVYIGRFSYCYEYPLEKYFRSTIYMTYLNLTNFSNILDFEMSSKMSTFYLFWTGCVHY